MIAELVAAHQLQREDHIVITNPAHYNRAPLPHRIYGIQECNGLTATGYLLTLYVDWDSSTFQVWVPRTAQCVRVFE